MEEASFVDPLLTSLVQTLLSPLPFHKVSSLPQMTEAGELFLGFESRRGRILEIQRIFEVTIDVQMSTPLLVEIIPYETVTFRMPCWTLESSLKRGLSLVLGMAFTCLEPSVQHARAQITLAPPPILYNSRASNARGIRGVLGKVVLGFCVVALIWGWGRT